MTSKYALFQNQVNSDRILAYSMNPVTKMSAGYGCATFYQPPHDHRIHPERRDSDVMANNIQNYFDKGRRHTANDVMPNNCVWGAGVPLSSAYGPLNAATRTRKDCNPSTEVYYPRFDYHACAQPYKIASNSFMGIDTRNKQRDMWFRNQL